MGILRLTPLPPIRKISKFNDLHGIPPKDPETKELYVKSSAVRSCRRGFGRTRREELGRGERVVQNMEPPMQLSAMSRQLPVHRAKPPVDWQRNKAASQRAERAQGKGGTEGEGRQLTKVTSGTELS